MKCKSKICFLLSKFSRGGGERVVSILSDELLQYYDVDVLLLQSKSENDYKTGARIIEINQKTHPNNFALLFYSIIGIKKYVQENKPKAIISFMELPNLINLLVVGNHKKIISVRNYMSAKWGAKKNIWNWSIRHMYKKADAIVSPTQLIANDLIKRYRIDENSIKLIHNPYKLDDVRKNVINHCPAEYTITTMGSIVKAKGVYHLLRSYILFCKEHSDIISKLVFIGDGIETKTLKKIVKEAGMEKNVIFKGFMQNPHKELAESSLYVLASFYEGFPNALLEAMICQIPVIATDCPSGPREILSETQIDQINHITKCDYGYLMPVFDHNVEQKEKELAKFFYDFYMVSKKEKKQLIEKAAFKTLSFESAKVAEEWRQLIETL